MYIEDVELAAVILLGSGNPSPPSLLMIIRSSFPSPSSSSPLIHVFSSSCHSFFLSLLIFPTYVSLV